VCLNGSFHNINTKCVRLHGCMVGALHPICMPIVEFVKDGLSKNDNSLHPVGWISNKCVRLHGCVVGALHADSCICKGWFEQKCEFSPSCVMDH